MDTKDTATLPDISYFIQASLRQGWCHLQSEQAVIWPTGQQPSRYRPLAALTKHQPIRHPQLNLLKVDEPPHSQSRSDVSLALSEVFNPQDLNDRFPARRLLLLPATEAMQSLERYLLARQSSLLAADPDAEAEAWLLFLPTATKLTLSWVQLDTVSTAFEQSKLFTTVVLAEYACTEHNNTSIPDAMAAVLLQWLAQWCIETVDVSCCQLVDKLPASTRLWLLLCQQWCQCLALEFIADIGMTSEVVMPYAE